MLWRGGRGGLALGLGRTMAPGRRVDGLSTCGGSGPVEFGRMVVVVSGGKLVVR